VKPQTTSKELQAGKACSAVTAIAATFTAEPLLPYLRYLLEAVNLTFDVRFAPYNQVFQELLVSTSLLGANTAGINIVLVRIEDFVRNVETVERAREIINRIVPELCGALTQHARRAKSPTLFAALQPSPTAMGGLKSELEAAAEALITHVRKLPGLVVLAPEEIDLVSTIERYDDEGDELGHIPYSEHYYAAIAAAIARKIHALYVPAHKVLVLDCDETLWRGVVGEDGIDGISVPPQLAQLQEFAVNLQAQGVLICLVSKNSESDVLDIFEKRSDMMLKMEHVVAHRINWLPKPQNLASLARALNLGLDSFVFIDDNPVECALMRSELPQVMTLQLPSEDEIEGFLSHLWAFDKIGVTEEDARRTVMYRENAARQEIEGSSTDIAAFIASLGVVVDIESPQDNEWPRLAQLTQRTNQFNFTTIRRTEAELRALGDTGSTLLRVRVRDRFGDYGLVGVVIAHEIGDVIAVDTLLLSCRVLGRGVEHAILRRLGDIAQERARSFVDLPYAETPKNEPARAFIESVAASYRLHKRERVVYRIPSDKASVIAHRPGHDPAAIVEARKSEERKSTASSHTSSGSVRSERYARLAQMLVSSARLVEATRAADVKGRALASDPVLPATDLERELLGLWEQLIGATGLGLEDDYAAVGGTSLVAARLFAEIARRYGTRLPLTTILEAPTVRSLAECVAQQRAGQSGALIALKNGGPRNLFLVHDGDGETLLYANLARRMPEEFGVFGIEPLRIRGVPLAHTTIEEMAAYYLQRVRSKQRYGPYFLGGMCAGGVVAYEMAYQLQRDGETVALLAILDAAAPLAARRPGLIAKGRLNRVRAEIDRIRNAGGNPIKQRYLVTQTVMRKLTNALTWEVTQRLARLSVKARFRLLRSLLARKKAWPASVSEMSVRQIYDSAEAHYCPKPLRILSAVLVRAQTGEGDDTPYRHIYSDETFGWGKLVDDLTVLDVNGGHASMLQEPYVGSLVEGLKGHMRRNASTPSTVRILEATSQ
jgi:FkbH-like protein